MATNITNFNQQAMDQFTLADDDPSHLGADPLKVFGGGLELGG